MVERCGGVGDSFLCAVLRPPLPCCDALSVSVCVCVFLCVSVFETRVIGVALLWVPSLPLWPVPPW